jgi:hypothetical protein
MKIIYTNLMMMTSNLQKINKINKLIIFKIIKQKIFKKINKYKILLKKVIFF